MDFVVALMMFYYCDSIDEELVASHGIDT